MSRDNTMRGDWDKRARENAYHWVLSSRLDWDKDSYYEEGEKHIKQYVLPFFDQRGIPQEQYRGFQVLDIGCGTDVSAVHSRSIPIASSASTSPPRCSKRPQRTTRTRRTWNSSLDRGRICPPYQKSLLTSASASSSSNTYHQNPLFSGTSRRYSVFSRREDTRRFRCVADPATLQRRYSGRKGVITSTLLLLCGRGGSPSRGFGAMTPFSEQTTRKGSCRS